MSRINNGFVYQPVVYINHRRMLLLYYFLSPLLLLLLDAYVSFCLPRHLQVFSRTAAQLSSAIYNGD